MPQSMGTKYKSTANKYKLTAYKYKLMGTKQTFKFLLNGI